jgi:MraZ protein
VFYGEFNLKIDTKGRASIPKELRDVLLEQCGVDSLVVTKSVHRGLLAYPVSEFAAFKKSIIDQAGSAEKTAMMRLMLTPATEVALDQLGRLPIPRSLRHYAQLNGDEKKDIVVVGMENRIEIWEASIYDQVVTDSESRLLDSPDFLSRFGM